MSHFSKPNFEFSGNLITTGKIYKVTLFWVTLLIGPVLLTYCGITNHFKIQWPKLIIFYYHEPMS